MGVDPMASAAEEWPLTHAYLIFCLFSLCREDPYIPRKYTTKCSTVLSVQYSTKNSLVAVGLA